MGKKLPDMSGMVVVVTGCSSGTGFVCATTCATRGATVLMLNRKSSKAEAAEAKIKAVATESGKVVTIECDLMNFDSVRKAAEEINTKYAEDGVDVLCCNAGVMNLKDVATGDKYDQQMQTNHLSHFLLVKEVFPLLETAAAKRGQARIVLHASAARHLTNGLQEKYLGPNGGNLGGDAVGMMKKEGRTPRYAQSKLANSVFIQALHQKLTAKGSKVKALAAAPGFASTGLQQGMEADGAEKQSAFAIKHMAQTQEDGTMGLLTACFGADAISGEFYEPKGWPGGMPGLGPPKRAKITKKEVDPAAMKLLWDMSEKACGKWEL